MELIRKLGTRIINGRVESFAIFLCPYCLQEVERPLSDGKRQKSCGCVIKELQSKAKKGQKRTPFSKETVYRMSLAKKGKSSNRLGVKLTIEQREKISIANKGKKHTKATRQKIGEGNKGKIVSEETRQKMKKPKTEEHKEKISKSLKGKYSGVKSPHWNNGSSFEPYGIDFNETKKQQVLERDNYICQDPNCDGNHKKLHIHHIDYDKKNNNPENLITLCNSCHSKTNPKNKRQYYTEFYQNIMMGKLMECLL